MKVLCLVALLVAVAQAAPANDQASLQAIGKELAKEKDSKSEVQILGNILGNKDMELQQFAEPQNEAEAEDEPQEQDDVDEEDEAAPEEVQGLDDNTADQDEDIQKLQALEAEMEHHQGSGRPNLRQRREVNANNNRVVASRRTGVQANANAYVLGLKTVNLNALLALGGRGRRPRGSPRPGPSSPRPSRPSRPSFEHNGDENFIQNNENTIEKL